MRAIPATLAALALGVLGATGPAAARASEAFATAGAPSEAAGRFALWVLLSGDHDRRPFAVVDKAAAQVSVYGRDGQLIGVAPALLGLAPGDDSVPGIGDRKLSEILPEERTTPAGRFVAFYGPAAGDQTVLWVDFEHAVSLHPVVTSNRAERRQERLDSAEADDNRITFGCINVPKGFYKDVVYPSFNGSPGIVYVLPETRAFAEVFPSAPPALAAAFEPTVKAEDPPRIELAEAPSPDREREPGD